jgi:putative hydrolase of the HAD superfamily
MKYRAVIFDLFGTLVDNFTSGEYKRVLDEMADILGVPHDDFGFSWRDSFPLRVNGTHITPRESIEYVCNELGAAVTGEQVRHAAAIRLDYTARSLKPRQEAVPTLEKLRADGYRTALVSDCSGEVPAVWDDTPFATLFGAAVFSCVAGIKKPDPRIYRIAMSRIGVTARDCLYVGDGSSHELTGARAVGMRPVMIRDPGESADAHFIDREDWSGEVISSLQEVLDLVK